jgi:hypothetical protein
VRGIQKLRIAVHGIEIPSLYVSRTRSLTLSHSHTHSRIHTQTYTRRHTHRDTRTQMHNIALSEKVKYAAHTFSPLMTLHHD